MNLLPGIMIFLIDLCRHKENVDLESQDPRFNANLGLVQNFSQSGQNNLRCSHSICPDLGVCFVQLTVPALVRWDPLPSCPFSRPCLWTPSLREKPQPQPLVLIFFGLCHNLEITKVKIQALFLA